MLKAEPGLELKRNYEYAFGLLQKWLLPLPPQYCLASSYKSNSQNQTLLQGNTPCFVEGCTLKDFALGSQENIYQCKTKT